MAQRRCPDIEAARAPGRPAAWQWRVHPGCRAYVRLVLRRRRHRVGALGQFLLNGGRLPGSVSNALQGRRLVVAAEWDRIRAVVEALAVGLSLEPEPERVARDDLAAVLADRLNRPTDRRRQAVDGEVLAIVMQAPLVAAAMPPRPAFPRYMRRAPAAA